MLVPLGSASVNVNVTQCQTSWLTPMPPLQIGATPGETTLFGFEPPDAAVALEESSGTSRYLGFHIMKSHPPLIEAT